MIKNIIFDMGNVLITYEPKAYISRYSPARQYDEMLYRNVFCSLEWLQIDKGTISEEQAIESICSRLPVKLHESVRKVFTQWHDDLYPIDGMYWLVKQLKAKGYKIYLLSNTSKRFHVFRKNIPALQFFDGEVISADVNLIKPAPDIYTLLLEKYDLKAEESFFIDDMAVNILTAHELGIKGFIYQNNIKSLRCELEGHGILSRAPQGVIFDLDGVLVSTDEMHYQAWKQLAEHENIAFTREDNERLRGVSRQQSLDIILEKSSRTYSKAEKDSLASIKNETYKQLLKTLSPGHVLPYARQTVEKLNEQGILTAIGSSSKNAVTILEQTGIKLLFDVIVDGNDITRGKPYPDVFLMAAEKLGLPSEKCVVIEDAHAGIQAALSAGMKAVGVGCAASSTKADYTIHSLNEFDLVKKAIGI